VICGTATTPLIGASVLAVAECLADEEFGGCGEYLEITPPARFMCRIVALSGSARK
jgi:hypothetical protein